MKQTSLSSLLADVLPLEIRNLEKNVFIIILKNLISATAWSCIMRKLELKQKIKSQQIIHIGQFRENKVRNKCKKCGHSLNSWNRTKADGLCCACREGFEKLTKDSDRVSLMKTASKFLQIPILEEI